MITGVGAQSQSRAQSASSSARTQSGSRAGGTVIEEVNDKIEEKAIED